MDKILGWIFIVGTLFMASCGRSIPDDVISPTKMENILYDYHMALGISSHLSAADNHKRQSYNNYLFKKYNITEAQFDSSMVWYTRNAYELAAIYQNLDKRFNKEKTRINALLKERHMDVITQSGDTVDIWSYYPVYRLIDKFLSNKITFEMKADSNFWVNDAFLWNANVAFLSPGRVTVGLNICLNNDSIIGKTINVTQSEKSSIYIEADSLSEIKNINGFIQVYKDSINQEPNVIISNLSLIKYHQNDEKIVPKIADKKDITFDKEIKKDNEGSLKSSKKVERVTSRPKRQVSKEE